MLRYLPKVLGGDLTGLAEDYVLGWTEVDGIRERLPFVHDPRAKRRIGDDWLKSGRSLLAVVQSAVLPEGDLVLMNPRHPDFAMVPPLTVRTFSFAECLAVPPS